MHAFDRLHPAVSFLYFLSVLLVAMFVTHPIIQLIALAGAICFGLMLQSRQEIKRNVGFYLPLLALVVITNPLISHSGATKLFYLNGKPITAEAFWYGLSIAVMIMAVLLWCQAYSTIVTSDKFLFLFGKTIPKLSLILSLALRFVPQLKQQLHTVSRAQKAMGLYAGKRYGDRLRQALRVLMAMIAWSMENAMETAASMKARGYGLSGRTHFSLYRFTFTDGILLSISLLLLLATLWGVQAGLTDFTYYPRISALNSSAEAIAVDIAFALLAFLPFIVEIKERFTWKFYVSKI